MKQVLAALLVAFSHSVLAVSTNFTGTVSTGCSLSVSQGGALALNPANTKSFSSQNAGGSASVVTASFTGAPTLSIQGPTTFVTQPYNDFAAVFLTSAVSSVTGSMVFNGAMFSSKVLSGAQDIITLNLSATAPGASVFANGSYTAEIVVTCS